VAGELPNIDPSDPTYPTPIQSEWSSPATIAAVNDAPVAVDQIGAQSVVTNEDSLNVPITLVATDVDSLGPLTYSIVTPPTHGTLNGVPPSVTYTPYLNYFGPDSFTFKANDASLPYNPDGRDSEPATVSIVVNPVNDVPSFTKGANQTVSQNAGPQSVALWATAISAGPTNSTPPTVLPDVIPTEGGQAVNFIVTNNNNLLFSGQPSISPAGTLTYTPGPNKSGVATVTVRIHDNGGAPGVDTSDAQTFTITVVVPKKLTAATPADIWFGLKTPADVGTKFDIKVEALKNDTVVASGTITNVTIGSLASSTYNPTKAVLKKVAMSAIASPGVPFGSGDQLKLKVYAKFKSPPAGQPTKTSATATLWFNIPGALDDTSSHLHAKLGGVDKKYYLVGASGSPPVARALQESPGSGAQSVDVAVVKNGPLVLFGTWSIEPAP
jgi:hypothetical protein